MACSKCGESNVNRAARGAQGINSGPNGVYELYDYPDCFRPYNGIRRNDSIYVIGIKTEGERLFVHSEARAAVKYSKDSGLNLIQLPVTQVCHDAIVDLFAEA